MPQHRIADVPEPRRGDAWTATRHAWLELLEQGPAECGKEFKNAALMCRHYGWADWLRGPDGAVVYGDQRQQLTAFGRALLAAWRTAGRRPASQHADES